MIINDLFNKKKQGVAESMAGKVVFSGTGANGGKYEIIQSGPTDFMIHANGKHIDTYGSLQRAMSVLKNEVPGLQQGVAEGEAPLKHHTARVSYHKEGDPHRRYEAIFKTTHNGGKEETEKRAKAAFAAKKKIVYNIVHEQDVAEGSDSNLSYQGNCTEDDVIEHIFGDVNNFANMVEEHGDEFTVGDLVVKYDPETDVHSFYYKKQGVAENFADGKNPGRKGLSKRVGIPKKATLGQLEKIAGSSTGERRRMAQWQLNMRRGKKK
jgi:hypothetical protein